MQRTVKGILYGAVLASSGAAFATGAAPQAPQEIHWAAEHAALAKYDVQDNQATLLFSNSPETVTAYGKLFRGTLNGLGRLYWYHLNGTEKSLYINVYAEAAEDAVVLLRRRVTAAPSRDYAEHGLALSRAEAEAGAREEVVRLAAGEVQRLAVCEQRLRSGELGSALLDLQTTGEVRFYVTATRVAEVSARSRERLPELAADGLHDRGTFPATMRRIRLHYTPARDGLQVLYLADGAHDEFLAGRDELGETAAKLRGNYGLTYRLTVASDGLGPYSLYFNPQGGAYAGVLNDYTRGRRTVALHTAPGETALGTDTLLAAVRIGSYETGGSVVLEWLPAGASNLPVRLWLAPDRSRERPLPERQETDEQENP
ncbi:MAG: hypothetical protein MR209_04940 [Veillonellaceae bacterium]|nr:hypothetical protein [Veillonellaceae bacterium]